eukprot:5750972-Prymnesium_polylepis.1
MYCARPASLRIRWSVRPTHSAAAGSYKAHWAGAEGRAHSPSWAVSRAVDHRGAVGENGCCSV